LTWATSTDPDTASEELSYKIYYSKQGEIAEDNLDDASTSTATTTQTAATLSNLDFNSTYYFGIKAIDPENNSSSLATTTPYKTATLAVVASGFSSSVSIDSNGRKIVRTSNGDLYVVYQRQGSFNKIFLAKSSDNGISWSEVEITSEEDQQNPSVAIDSQSNLHIAWQGKIGTSTVYQIRYIKYDGTSFSAIENFTADATKSQGTPFIAIDTQDKMHLAWVGKDNPGDRMHYIAGSSGIWGSIDTVKDEEFSGGLWSSISQFSFASDHSNSLHFVWFETVPAGGCCISIYLRYRKGEFENWSSIENIKIVDLHNYSSLAIDSQNNLHIVWHEPDNRGADGWVSLVQYLKCSGGCDASDIETLSEEKNDQTAASPSVAVDSVNNIYVVWKRHHSSQPKPVSQRAYKDGSWQ
jgi:hypothetical protein